MPEFDEILQGFRNLWARVGSRQFALEVFIPSAFDSANYPEQLQRLPLLCGICIPRTLDVDGFTSGGSILGHHARELVHEFDEFRALCMNAGAQLPAEVHTALAGYYRLFDRSPASIWLALLLFLRKATAIRRCGEVREDDGTLEEYQYEWVDSFFINEPFREMIGMIETLELNSDTGKPVEEWFNECMKEWETAANQETYPGELSRPTPANEWADEDQKRQELALIFLRELLDSGKLSRATVQKKTVALLIEYEGRLPIRDLGKEEGVGWSLEQYDNNTSTLLSRSRLGKHFSGRFGIKTENREIIVTVDGKPARD